MSRYKSLRAILMLPCLMSGWTAVADPIHATGAGNFQHHDSHWIFAGKVGEFSLVGVPQDIDGTSAAAAHYASTETGARITAAVHIYPAATAAVDAALQGSYAQASQCVKNEGSLRLDDDRRPDDAAELIARSFVCDANRAEESQSRRYLVTSGDWSVQVVFLIPPLSDRDLIPALDCFVREQRWASLRLSSMACAAIECTR